MSGRLVSFKQISGIHLLRHIIQRRVVAVSNDGVTLRLEGHEVIDHHAPEEGGAVFERRLIDDYGGAFGLDALHDALDGGLAEVVRAGLHREAVDADGDFVLLCGVPGVLAAIAVVAGLLEDAVGDEVLARAIALHDGLDEVLGDVGVIREELLGVLREAVAAISKTRVIVVRADARVQANAVDDVARVQALTSA